MLIDNTQLPNYGLSVKDFGAQGDGANDDSHAFQEALDAGQELVTVPYGTYKIGRTLRIVSNTYLKVHPPARTFFVDGAGVDRGSFLITNKNPDRANVNISVEGGIWDGNNLHNPRGPDTPNSYTGVLINFVNVKGLSIRRLTVRDAESYFIRLAEVKKFRVEHIRFEAPHLRENQDSVYLGGFCEGGIIRSLVGIGPGVTNDDMVALSADDAIHRVQNLGLKCGPIRHIRVENLNADSCHTFIRLLSVSSPIEDVIIEGIYSGCRVCALNVDACRRCPAHFYQPILESHPQFPDGIGTINRPTLRDLDVYKASGEDDQPLLDLETELHDFTLTNFGRNTKLDANSQVPSLLISHIQPCPCDYRWPQTLSARSSKKESRGMCCENVQLSASVCGEESYRSDPKVNQGGFLLLYREAFEGLRINCT